MSRRHLNETDKRPASNRPRDNDPDSDPEPPAAPPVIILSRNSPRRAIQERRVDPGSQPQPHTSSPHSKTERYNLRKKPHRRPDPDPDPAPEPDPAPPIIILPSTQFDTKHNPNKRPASRSPAHSTTPSSPLSPPASPPRTTPPPQSAKMGSKGSKLAHSQDTSRRQSKLQPSTSKADKEQMKEPSNYYSHRSKSMRRKAGKTPGGPAASGASGDAGGSGGGLQ